MKSGAVVTKNCTPGSIVKVKGRLAEWPKAAVC